MRPVTHSLLPEVGSVQSSDVNMEGRLGSQYALRRSSPQPTGSVPSPPRRGSGPLASWHPWQNQVLVQREYALLFIIGIPVEGFI